MELRADHTDEYGRLAEYLGRWDRRRRLVDGLIWLPRGLLAGLLLAVIVATAARLLPLLSSVELAYTASALAALGMLAAVTVLLLQRRTLLQQARFADRQFHLRERASSAVEIQLGMLATHPALGAQQLADTLRAAQLVNAKAGLPLRLNWQDLALLALSTALLMAAVLLPNAQAEVLARQRAVEAAVEEQIQALEGLVEDIQQNPELTATQKEELLEPIEGALEELRVGNLSQEEAVAVLSETAADLREIGEVNQAEALRESLVEAGQALADSPASQDLAQALQGGDLGAAGAAANQLADSLPTLTAEEVAALAQDLAESAAALEEIDPELAAELAQAAQALQEGNLAGAQQALREAAATLQQRAQEQAAARQAAAAAGQLDESRQAVAQAGQSGQPAQGEGQLGQGQQGQGQGDGEGQSTAQGSGTQTEQGQGTGGPGPGGGHAEDVYVPDTVDLGDEAGVDIELPAECVANPANCGALITENPTEFGDERSLVPYDQVFGDYRDAAYEALDEEYIPLGLKGFVRDYFSSLEP